jgi:molecular chaperone GrpE
MAMEDEKGTTIPVEEAGAEAEHHASKRPSKHDLEMETAQLHERLEKAETESAEYLDGLRRLKAEFENYRKRMVREQTGFLESANAELVSKLLPVLDSMDLAVRHVAEKGNEGLIEGLTMVHGQMTDVLRAEGLEEIDPQGDPFDPTESEALMTIESEEHDDCTVVEVLKKGYRFRGKLLRPAMVTVSKCPTQL